VNKIELALGMILAPFKDHQILRPANFSHQWCEFFVIAVFLVEVSDSPEVSSREARNPRELRTQISCQVLHNSTTPSLALLPLLYQPADVPVQIDQLTVHGSKRRQLSRANSLFDLAE
jgi:hypothetical protein